MSQAPTTWTGGEVLATAAAERIRDQDVVVVGLGLPQIAALLAKRIHAPDAVLLLENGVFEPQPREPAMGIADPRLWEGASAFGGMLDVLGAMLHGGRVTLGMLGALEVDGWGSLNSTAVADANGHVRRFNGSGGANDIASSAGRVVVVMRHHERKFRDTLRFCTSPGRRVGGIARADLGLAGEGPVAVVTDRAVIAVTDSGPTLAQVHPGETPTAVRQSTPFELADPPAGVAITPDPTSFQLSLIRDELDPHGWYTQ